VRKTLRPKLGEALLASGTPDVRRGASPATRIGERLVARKLLVPAGIKKYSPSCSVSIGSSTFSVMLPNAWYLHQGIPRHGEQTTGFKIIIVSERETSSARASLPRSTALCDPNGRNRYSSRRTNKARKARPRKPSRRRPAS